jgi:hypothetical protein
MLTARRLATTGTTRTTRMIARPMDIMAPAGLTTACSSALAPGMDLAGVVGAVGATDVALVTDIAAGMDIAADTVDMDTVVDTAAIEADMDALVMAADGLDTAEDALVAPTADMQAATVVDDPAAAGALAAADMPWAAAATQVVAADMVAVVTGK